jgi:glycosyltransferase involved in cell wall biosynthesis
MRVLHLLGAAEDTGGILSVIRGLHLAAAGARGEHVVWVNRAYQETRQPALAYRRSRHLLDESPNHFNLLWRALRSLGELKQLLRCEPFEVLHGHSRGALPLAVVVSALWRRPVLFTNHAYAHSHLGLYRWAACRRLMHTSVLTPNMARHYGFSLAAPRFSVISECCADRFFAAPLAGRSGPGKAPLRLVGLGNLVGWKNWHLLLEALGELTEAERARLEFHHWGPTPQDAASLAYAQRLQEHVRGRHLGKVVFFHGLSLRVEEPLQQADWFVLPSTNEPCSVALIEALALGVPALASASGGNGDIIQAGVTGLLFTPGSADDLRDQLRFILAGKAQPASPERTRESVRHRSASSVAAQYSRVYERLLAQDQPD